MMWYHPRAASDWADNLFAYSVLAVYSPSRLAKITAELPS